MTLHHDVSLACRLVVLVLAALVSTVACDDSGDDTGRDKDVQQPLDTSGTPDGTGGGDGEGDTLPISCSADEPCAEAGQVCDPASSQCVARCSAGSCDAGLVCDLASGLCIAGSGCTTSEDCTGADEVCNTCRGVCESVPGARTCVEALNCFSDQYCEPCTGTCREKVALCESCVFDRECGETEDRCIDLISSGGRFCLQSCTSTPECPPGYECATISSGVQQCVPASGNCAQPAECEGENDAQCAGENEICRDGRCVPGCTMGGCPGSQVCERGRCKAPCTERPEGCAAPTMCETATGLCKYEGECIESRECPAQHYCDVSIQRCVAGCQVDNDCRTFGLACVNGQCERRGCTGAYACAFEQVCELSTGMCEPAQGPYCETCDPQAEGACGGDPNKCLELQDADGNSMGSFCFVACSSDPDNRCPQGYQCTELQDGDGNPAGEICFRDCTTDPFG